MGMVNWSSRAWSNRCMSRCASKSSANAFYYQKLGFIAACYPLLSRVYETEEQVCGFRISGDPCFHRAVLACPTQNLIQQQKQRCTHRLGGDCHLALCPVATNDSNAVV